MYRTLSRSGALALCALALVLATSWFNRRSEAAKPNCAALAIEALALPGGTVNQPFSAALESEGGSGSYTFSKLLGTLPNGITLQPNGTFTGTPTQPGIFTFTVQTQDANGCSGTQDFSLTINCQTLDVTAPANNTGLVNAPFSAQFAQTGGIGTTTFSTTSVLPEQITLAPSGTLSGTPNQTGSFPLVVTATDSNGCTGTVNYTLTISGCPTSFTVNSLLDTPDAVLGNGACADANGQCTLRAALQEANTITLCAPLTINFSVNGTLNLATELPALAHPDLTINGPGAKLLTVARLSTAAAFGILAVGSGQTAKISGLTISGGAAAGDGGGIFNGGNLTLRDCLVRGNAANQGGGLFSTGGTLDVSGCTFTGNHANQLGGGLNLSFTTATVANTTIVGNDANFGGGGINGFFSDVTLTNNTLTDNTAGFEGSQLRSESNSAFNVRNTLVAHVTNAASVLFGSYTSQGHNFVGSSDGTNGFTNAANSDQVGAPAAPLDAKLAELADYGGPTSTRALLPGSPALNAGTATNAPATDQRGLARVAAPDIGAFESRGFTLTASAGHPQSTLINTAFAQPLTVTVSNAFNEPVTGGCVVFSAPGNGASAALNGTPATIQANGNASVTATANGVIGAYTVTANASGATGAANFNLNNLCQPLVISPPTLPSGTRGVFYNQPLSVANAFANTANFALTSGVLPSGITLSAVGVLIGTPAQAGSFTFTVTVTDVRACAGSQTFTLVIACPNLSLTPATLPNGQVGLAYNQSLAANGVGPLSFTLFNSQLPTGLTLATNGLISGTPSVAGNFSFVVKVTDAQGCLGTQSYNVNIGCPAITLAALPAATAGVGYNADLLASPTGGGYGFALAGGSQLPPGLALAAGKLTGTPTQAGSFAFNLSVSGFGGTCGQTLPVTLTINCPAVTVNPTSLPNASLGAPYTQTLSATPVGTAYSFALSPGGQLPPGLTLASNGSLSGTPSASGTFSFIVTATGFGNCPGTRAYSLTVVATCPALTINPLSLPNGTLSTAYAQMLSATGGNGPFTFAVTAGTLPSGLTLAAPGNLSGTPNASGTFNFTVTVTGAGGCTGTRSYSITIGCTGFALNPTSLSSAVAGVNYSQQFSATPTGSYSFAITQGSLPPGLSLNASGLLSGMANVTGSYNFTVTATAAGGCAVARSYTLSVACPTITLTPTSLPNGQRGTLYSQTLAANPAGANYSFSVASGTLPSGLTLSQAGLLSGTPTAAGSFTFTVKAIGFGACSGTRSYTMTITAACAAITLPSLPTTGGLGQPYTGDLSGITPAGNYSFTVTAGALPPGLTLDGFSQTLFGTLTGAGTFNFTLTATSNGCSGSRAYTLVISRLAVSLAQVADYDGDNQSDPVLWRPATGGWNMMTSAQNRQQNQIWGSASDVALLGDYDGDGKTDLAVFRPGNGTFYVKRSSDGSALVKQWGAAEDVPVPGDYDGDGLTDFAVWRGSNGTWYIFRSSDQQAAVVSWGTSAAPYLDVPVAGDYDGDGKTDVAVFRRASGTWLLKRSRDGQTVVKVWGTGSDVPVASDYDGDGQTDLAVWRGATGEWFVLKSSDQSYQVTIWGGAAYGDLPAPGDYDGDGRADLAVWRANGGTWFHLLSGQSGSTAIKTLLHGQLGDRPIIITPQH